MGKIELVSGVYDAAKGETKIKRKDKFSKDSGFQLSFDLAGKQGVKKVALGDFIKGEATISWGSIVQGVSMDSGLESFISSAAVDVELMWAPEYKIKVITKNGKRTEQVTTTYKEKCQPTKWSVVFSTISLGRSGCSFGLIRSSSR